MSGPGLQGKMCQPPQKNFPAAGLGRQGKKGRKAVGSVRDEPGTRHDPDSHQPCCRLSACPNLHLQTGAAAATSYPAPEEASPASCSCSSEGLAAPGQDPPQGRASAPAQTCGRGETGSHSGLKIRRPQTAYGFESRRPHQTGKLDASLLSFAFCLWARPCAAVAGWLRELR